MNYRRWIIVGFIIAISIFTFCHLCTSGDDYEFLTTSDSGYFYGIAQEINQEDGFIDNYTLSHAPQGKSVPQKNQFQPLLLVTFYRGLNAVNPNVTLHTASQYIGPFLFALAVIGAFLAAKELGGDLAGCASALFFSTLVGSMYWSKIGAFDREITLIFFGTWLFYLIIKVFKSKGFGILKWSIFAGLLYGLFLITWGGALFLGVIIGLALLLIILEKAVSGLGFLLVGILSILVGSSFGPFDVAELIGVFTILAGLIRIARDWESVKVIEKRIFESIRSNLRTIGGILTVLGISTIIVVLLGGSSPDIWINLFTNKIAGFVGIGGGGAGATFPAFAGEMAKASPSLGQYFFRPRSSVDLVTQLYRNPVLVHITILLIAAAMTKVFMTSKNENYLAFAWLFILAPMPLQQGRFFRMFWPMWPVLAGFGVGVCIGWAKDLIFSPSLSTSGIWEKIRHPLVLAIVFVILVTPFIFNARANASGTSPAPHAGSLGYNKRYFDLYEASEWIKNDSQGLPYEDSIIGIHWSYGSFVAGASNRPTMTDGAQTSGWRGEWENAQGPKPPDYIKYIDNQGNGKIIGLRDVPIRENEVNGRRIDMRILYSANPENFADILRLYEKYDVGLDYCIFDYTSSHQYGRMYSFEKVFNSNIENVRNSQNTELIARTQQGPIIRYYFENSHVDLVLSGKFARASMVEYRHLFNVDNDMIECIIDNLNVENINTELENAFSEKDYELSDEASASLIEEDNSWKIIDGDNTYTIENGKGNLEIYEDKRSKIGVFLRSKIRKEEGHKLVFQFANDMAGFRPTDFAHKTLIIDQRNKGLVPSPENNKLPRALLADYRVPVSKLVKSDYKLPHYIENVFYPSSRRNFVVAKINEEEL